MVQLTVTLIRPLPITPFYIFPVESVRLLEEMKSQGKLLDITQSLSEDQLTRTTVFEWASREALQEFDSHPVQKELYEQQAKYNEITGIVKLRSIAE